VGESVTVGEAVKAGVGLTVHENVLLGLLAGVAEIVEVGLTEGEAATVGLPVEVGVVRLRGEEDHFAPLLGSQLESDRLLSGGT